MHAKSIQRIDHTAVPKHGDDIPLPDDFDPLALD
jgi:hypothetical protein